MKEQLTAILLDFLAVVGRCWHATNSTQDRPVYQQDAAIVAWWVARLADGDVRPVVDEILSPQTKKHFYDYWRSGEWGESETNAFARMTEAVEVLRLPD